jgi:hypothetical protein
MIQNVLHNPKSEFFFSFLVGIGLSVMLFHRPIRWQKILAMNPSEIEGKVVKADGKCVTYRVEDTSCEITSVK